MVWSKAQYKDQASYVKAYRTSNKFPTKEISMT